MLSISETFEARENNLVNRYRQYIELIHSIWRDESRLDLPRSSIGIWKYPAFRSNLIYMLGLNVR